MYRPGRSETSAVFWSAAVVSNKSAYHPNSFEEEKTQEGASLPFNGKTSVLVDQNIFLWVSKTTILGGTYAALADLPVANTSLTTVRFGALAGGSGFADSYFSPFTLGWKKSRADIEAGDGFMAPTRRFPPGGAHNTGGGPWGHP